MRWQIELEEYISQGEPEQAEKSEAWQIAIGLQQVDGLQISEYLLDTAKEHIEGKLTIGEVQKRIHSYYEEHYKRISIENTYKEADMVSARTVQLLEEKTFQLSIDELINIHCLLFDGVFKSTGKFRDYNITKKEWVLKGDTVIYASYEVVQDALNYMFLTEQKFSYSTLVDANVIRHFSEFASDIWQIHSFGDGNTRTIAVFMIKYMRVLGYSVDSKVFGKCSWFFRNALVRANYNDLPSRVYSTKSFLEMFFSNLLLGSDYELKNRYMHVDFRVNVKYFNGNLK